MNICYPFLNLQSFHIKFVIWLILHYILSTFNLFKQTEENKRKKTYIVIHPLFTMCKIIPQISFFQFQKVFKLYYLTFIGCLHFNHLFKYSNGQTIAVICFEKINNVLFGIQTHKVNNFVNTTDWHFTKLYITNIKPR